MSFFFILVMISKFAVDNLTLIDALWKPVTLTTSAP